MTVRDGLAVAAARLSAVSATPRLDAELLMAEALGCTRDALILGGQEAQVPAAFETLVERRLAHEPIAYILGRRAFWTIELEVGPGVLVPRPDSETLIEAALDRFGKAGPGTILDLGTGPGTLLLAALDQWPAAAGLGVDRSPAALRLARRNAERLGLASRARFLEGDWGEGLEARFDLILCNPPYVEEEADLPADVRDWEPPEALFAGPEGLDAYRRLAPQMTRLLSPQGLACVELGAGQAEAAAALFREQGLAAATRKDLAGVERCLVLGRADDLRFSSWIIAKP